jgi:ParB/RepB/Spo0J family partition protein
MSAATEGRLVQPGDSIVQEIRIDRIRESTTNPRRAFDESQLRELADNIQVHGVLQPIVLRPAPDGVEGRYELVAGARRLRASCAEPFDTSRAEKWRSEPQRKRSAK